MKDFTNYEMQELLPDYAFGRLEPELRTAFEQNLSKYPDIQEELNNVQAVFSKVEATDFDAIFNKRTRNLSVAVNNRLSKPKKSFMGSSIRLAYPILTVFVLGVGFYWMFLSNNKTNVSENTPQFANSKIETFTEKDLDLLIDSTTTIKDLEEIQEVITDNSSILAQNDISNYNEQVLETMALQLMSEDIINKMNRPAEVSSADNYASYYSFLENADQISEENIQYILKELQDGNF